MRDDDLVSTAPGTAGHWDEAYGHGDTTRSWFQAQAVQSARMLDTSGITAADGLIDVGGGASRLVDALLARGHIDLTVLDISAAGLHAAQQRLGAAAERVRWVVVDLLTWQPARTYRVWHDRAVFHFLTTEPSRRRYLQVLDTATAADSVAVLATFAPGGPQQCSGLPVARYSARELADLLGEHWLPIENDHEAHVTPAGGVQPFTWAAFRRQP